MDNMKITLASSPKGNTYMSDIWLQLRKVRLGLGLGYFSLEPKN